MIVGYMYQTLTNQWQDQLDRAQVTARVGAIRAKELYSQDAAFDHYVVGDPDRPNDGSQRSGKDPGDEDDDDDEGSRILAVLRKHNNNRRRAAAELGISRVSLYKKLHKSGLFVRKIAAQPTQ